MSDPDIYAKYSDLLKAIQSLVNADYCSIFLLDAPLEMDVEEKKEVCRDRMPTILERNAGNEFDISFLKHFDPDHVYKYSVLTYFTGTGNKRWKIEEYDHRPQKYLVFEWRKKAADGEHIRINSEGLTAYVVRTGQPIFYNNRASIEDDSSFSGINEGRSGVHDVCIQVALIPLVNSSGESRATIGCLRCDIYQFQSETLFSEDTIAKLEQLNDVTCKIINLGKEYEKSLSYSSLFKGINILDSLKAIRNMVTDGTDREVYKLTKKLFYVLKRRRYFSYRSIIDRIMGYFKNICTKLNLKYEPLQALLVSFKKHEDLMLYSNERYRDHFMHQFHVFIIGYIVMHFIGMDKIIQIMQDNMRGYDLRNVKPSSLLRIWFLASIFHDSCYLLPRFDDNISAFLTEILKGYEKVEKAESDSKKFKFNVDLKWEQLAKIEAGFLARLSEIAHMLGLQNRNIDLCKFTSSMSRLMVERNHGVLSALIMTQKMAHANEIGLMLYEFELNLAALAIALHTIQGQTIIGESLDVDEKEKKIYFDNNPIIFLLGFCDFAQEWGRKESEIMRMENRNYAKASFHSLTFEDDQCIHIKLIYNYRDFEPGQEAPSKADIIKWAEALCKIYSSFKFSFKITYYGIDSEAPTEHELNRGEIHHIDLRDCYKRKALRKRCKEFLYPLPGGRMIFITDYSSDSFSKNVGIGFGTNDTFKVGEELRLELIYDDTDLSGNYEVVRAEHAKGGLKYAKFVGVTKLPEAEIEAAATANL